MPCKNCNNQILEDDDYCGSCGAKVIRSRLTLKNLFEHLGETFFNYDNKLLRTFIDLIKNPEIVIGGYISGTRKKYVNVISYFALAITISGLQLFILNKFSPESMDISFFNMNQGTEAFQEKNLNFVQEYQSIIMMFYVPIYALMSKVVFFNLRKFNYTEHLVIYMYILAQASIIGAVIMLIAAIFDISIGVVGFFFIIPFQIIYSAYCLKRLFNLKFQGIILRTLFFFIVLAIAFVIFTIIFLSIMYLNGGLEEMIEAQKAAQVK